MNYIPTSTSYPPPAASQPATLGAPSVGRPWITLQRARVCQCTSNNKLLRNKEKKHG